MDSALLLQFVLGRSLQTKPWSLCGSFGGENSSEAPKWNAGLRSLTELEVRGGFGDLNWDPRRRINGYGVKNMLQSSLVDLYMGWMNSEG